MHSEQFSCFCELDLLCILGIGDIMIGMNFHIWTKSRIMLTNIYIHIFEVVEDRNHNKYSKIFC